jgi:hypothetical protein
VVFAIVIEPVAYVQAAKPHSSAAADGCATETRPELSFSAIFFIDVAVNSGSVTRRAFSERE